MVVLDSSVIVAVLRDEADAATWAAALAQADQVTVAAPTAVEAAVVLGEQRHGDLDDLLEECEAEVVSFGAEHARAARAAYARYGRGSGSPARLNLGDCFSYALATVSGQPLLFKGDDFTHTDVVAAAPPT